MSLIHRDLLRDLAETLGQERELLERLLFKLIEARLVLAADEARFVTQAMAEVEEVMDRIRLFEAKRATALDRFAKGAGLDKNKLTLAYLTEWAPEPYRTMLDDHRTHFQMLTAEVEQVTADNRRLANIALTNLTDTLGALVSPSGVALYTAGGTTRSSQPGGPVKFDQAL